MKDSSFATIVMVEVQSSHVHSIGYEAESQILQVVYKDAQGAPSARWQYVGVARDVWARLFGEGASVGRIIAEARRAPGVSSVKLAEVEA